MARPRRLKDGQWEIVADRVPHFDGRRRQVRRRFKTRDEATRALAQLQLERLENQTDESSGPTVGVFVESWLVDLGDDLAPTTLRRYKGIANAHILNDRIAEVPVTQVKADDLRDWLLRLRLKPGRTARCLSRRTIRHIYRLMSVILNEAVRRRIVDSSPLDGITVPVVRPNPDDVRSWTVDEVGALITTLRASTKPNAALWLAVWSLCLATGLRRGELAGLQWSDVDLDAQALTVKRTRLAGVAGTHPPKTKGAARTIPLSPEAVGFLDQLRDLQEADHRIFGPDRHDTGFVVVMPDGSAPQPDSFTQRFKRDCAQAGVPYISLHGLRHTFATLALAASVPAHIVSKALGHHSVAFTLTTYSHMLPGAHREAMERASGHIFQAPQQSADVDNL